MVSVHIGYAVGSFHCVLDSDLFVPEDWADDSARRKEVGMPADVTHRSKPEIALQQIRRALGNGIRVAAWTFDELYGGSYDFVDGLDRLGQTYVAEVPCTFCGWAKEPAVLVRPTPQEMRRKGKKRRFPRLSATATPVSEVRNLLNHSPAFQAQAWTPIHIKNGEKGAIVREVHPSAHVSVTVESSVREQDAPATGGRRVCCEQCRARRCGRFFPPVPRNCRRIRPRA